MRTLLTMTVGSLSLLLPLLLALKSLTGAARKSGAQTGAGTK